MNAGANIGNIFGQLTFGFLGDLFGRKFVYGKELIVCIIGMILVISLPNSIPTPTLKMIWIFCWRLLMGNGISFLLSCEQNSAWELLTKVNRSWNRR